MISMRPLLSSTLLVFALAGPIVATLLLMLVGLLYYPRYFEAVGVALMVELLYRGGVTSIWSAPAIFTLLTLLTLLIAELLRMVLRNHTR